MKSKRILMSVIGVIVTAVSVGAFKFAAFGVDPFQSFMSGIDKLIPLEFGTVYVLVNAVLLLFSLIFDRHYIGIATLINLSVLGYIVQLSLSALQLFFPNASIIARITAFLLGFIFLCLGSALYMTADLGVSTYDAIALVCTNKWHLGKFRYVRICTDLVCIAFGICMFLLGGGSADEITSFVGIGTIATAFCMGPLIDFFRANVSDPILHGKKAKRIGSFRRNIWKSGK